MSSYEELRSTIKEFPCIGKNEKGEAVMACIGWDDRGEYIKMETSQEDGLIRSNYYYEDGYTEETFRR